MTRGLVGFTMKTTSLWVGVNSGNLPQNLIYLFQSKVLRSRPNLPWWPFPAKEAIESLIQPNWNVIEFGSGSSTIWLAARARHVHSFEDNPEWYEKVRHRLSLQNLSNVTLRLRQGATFYDLRDFEDHTFDLAIVDGYCRFGCVQAVLPKLKAGGFIYLDNSDADKDALSSTAAHERKAQAFLRRYVQDNPTAKFAKAKRPDRGGITLDRGNVGRSLPAPTRAR